MRILIICIVLAFCIPAMAQDLETLTQQQAQITRAMFQTSGQVQLNNSIIVEAGRRSAALQDELARLNNQLGEVQKAIRKLTAVTTEKPKVE